MHCMTLREMVGIGLMYEKGDLIIKLGVAGFNTTPALIQVLFN
jgi:hypothetical protein